MEKRKCFGTKEWSNTSMICRRCPDYKECGLEYPKRNGLSKKVYYYLCPKCKSKKISWYILKEDYDRQKHYIGKCIKCGFNIKAEHRKRKIIK